MKNLKWSEWKRRLSLYFADNAYYQQMSPAMWVDLARSLFDSGYTLADAEAYCVRLFRFIEDFSLRFARIYAGVVAKRPSEN